MKLIAPLSGLPSEEAKIYSQKDLDEARYPLGKNTTSIISGSFATLVTSEALPIKSRPVRFASAGALSGGILYVASSYDKDESRSELVRNAAYSAVLTGLLFPVIMSFTNPEKSANK